MPFCRAICPPSSLTPVSQKVFSLTPGDAPTLRFEIVRPDNSPFNLADYDADFYIQRSVQDSIASAEFHGFLGTGIELGGEEKDGLLDVTIPATVTLALRLHQPYPWYLRLSHTITATKIYVPARGTFLLALPGT